MPFILMRHSQLLPPYDNYEKLSLSELEDLASGNLDPDVDPVFVKNNLENKDEWRALIKDSQVVLCGQARRARQTCSLVMDWAGLDLVPIVDHRINEIAFSPIALCGDSSEGTLKVLRKRLDDAIETGHAGVEGKSSITARVQDVLTEYKDKRVFCVSHGFLMKFITAHLCAEFGFSQSESCAPSAAAPVPYLGMLRIEV